MRPMEVRRAEIGQEVGITIAKKLADAYGISLDEFYRLHSESKE